MFEISKILKRAWQVLWNYKMLWVFALLLALSGGAGNGGGGGGGGGGTGGNANFPGSGSTDFFNSVNSPAWLQELGTWAEQNIAPMFATEESAIRTIILFIVIIFAIAIFFGLLFALVRYPAETVVIRMVDEHENTGAKLHFKEAWKLGWNRRAFRLWLIDLLIGAPAAGIVLFLVGGFSLLALRISRQADTRIMPTAVIGLLFIVLFFLFFALLMLVVGWLRQFVVRYAAIEETGVWESFRRGWAMFRSNLKNTIITGLVLIGLGIAFGIAAMIAFFLLIPAYAVMAIPGVIAAAIPGSIAYFIANAFSHVTALPWIIAAIFALPVFFTIAMSPASFLGGMFTVYTSNIWTLAFRQLKTGSVPPPPVPAVPVETH